MTQKSDSQNKVQANEQKQSKLNNRKQINSSKNGSQSLNNHSDNKQINQINEQIPNSSKLAVQDEKKSEQHELKQFEQQNQIQDENGEQLKVFNVKSNQQIKRQVKRWKHITESVQKRRQMQYQIFKNKLQLERVKQLEQKKQKNQLQMQMKRQKIKKKLEQIQQRKIKRVQNIQMSKASLHKKRITQPLYQQKQRQFQKKRQLDQAEMKNNILKKKKQMMLDMKQIREHEQKLIQHLKKRLQKNKSSKTLKSKSLNKQGEINQNQQVENQKATQGQLTRNHRSQFNIYVNHNPAQKQKDMQKYIRRKKFEQIVKKQIPILIDQQKKKQALIAKDKAQNPLKYNYLSNVAALSDEKIYEQFKDFEININPKQLGNQYMRQMHQKIPISSRIRSHSQSNLKGLQQKVEYKNYLPQIKSVLKKKQEKLQPTNQIQQVLYRYESNSDKLAQFNKKSNNYKYEAMRKISQIKRDSTNEQYNRFIGKEHEIDQLYVKSVKMKLAGALYS